MEDEGLLYGGGVMEQKKAWIYCCVAHNEPDSAEVLERQRHRLESYAKEHGFEIVGVSSDIGSGLTMDRPGLLDFHAAAEDGDTDILLIHSLTRLGRDANKVTKYWHLLRDLGVSVHAADCGEIDLSLETMLRRMIEDMRKYPR